ncbi:MAG: hypothetical protein ACLGXA_21615 [Acidobacteriota bacterium]
MFPASPGSAILAQTTDQKDLASQMEKLTGAMARAQAQIEESQRELNEMRAQLATLRSKMETGGSHGEAPVVPESSSAQTSTAALAAAVQDLRERQAMQEAQIATHEQAKVESESKYPVKVTGLLLLNGFVNSRGVDMAATPTVATSGGGSTGATMRQTILGLEARGPHVLGAQSYADLRVDFDGMPSNGASGGAYSGYYTGSASLLRLRTAHAGLRWDQTEVAFSLDRPIVSPDTPTSLTAVAIPALAWSGNLWTWNPQVVVTRNIDVSPARRIELQGAVTDVADAPLTPVISSAALVSPPSTAEQSRWPGVEARAALLGAPATNLRAGSHFGIGGFFEPHKSTFLARRFDSWAATLDASQPLAAGLELTGNFYRGQALGGLGGGAYKDVAYKPDNDGVGYYSRALDDVGGWAQLKERFSERLQMNGAFGIDNVIAGELRRYYVPGGTTYGNLARNRTYTGNVIYSPNAYLMFSLEYRHLVSSPVTGPAAASDVIGLGAGYRF